MDPTGTDRLVFAFEGYGGYPVLKKGIELNGGKITGTFGNNNRGITSLSQVLNFWHPWLLRERTHFHYYSRSTVRWNAIADEIAEKAKKKQQAL